MTDTDLQQMFNMVKAIYNHLGLDGNKVVSIIDIEKQARKDVLKWREKQSKKIMARHIKDNIY